MLLTETPTLPETKLQWTAIITLGLICSAYGFVIQSFAQRYISSEKVELIFFVKSVFSAILSYIFLYEILSIKGYLGAMLIFLGIALSKVKLPDLKKHFTAFN